MADLTLNHSSHQNGWFTGDMEALPQNGLQADLAKYGELLDIAVELELVNKSGSWFSIGDERIGQGRENAKNYLAEHPELAEELTAKVREHLEQMRYSRATAGKVNPKAADISADDFNED